MSKLDFGYLPTGRTKSDLVRRFLGYPNLVKRLQADDIMRALQISDSDTVLDVGCATGFFTVEMARLARFAVGVDVDVRSLPKAVPGAFSQRLQFELLAEPRLPFDDNTFDVVLCSEVLPVLANPSDMVSEILRVLKPGGRAVFVNGQGSHAIKQAFERNSWFIRMLRQLNLTRMPSDYAAYVRQLKSVYYTEVEMQPAVHWKQLVEVCGFEIDSVSTTPNDCASTWAGWLSFIWFIFTGNPTLGRSAWLAYPLVRVTSRSDGRMMGLSNVMVCSKPLRGCA